MLEKEEEVD